METPVGYCHDLFISYSRAQLWPVFVNNHFRPVLEHWLSSELGTDARIFQDVEDIETGHQWEDEIDRGLATSRVMVALLSRSYFQSEWCRHEFAAMLTRAESFRKKGLDDRVIFPVAMHDCETKDLPASVSSLHLLRIHQYADPFMHPNSVRREELSRVLQPLCRQIARRLEQITDDTFQWPLPDDADHRQLLVPAPRVRPSVPVLEALT